MSTAPADEPMQAEHAQADPVQAAPVQAAPVQAAPVQAAPVQADPVQADPVQADPVQADLARADDAADAMKDQLRKDVASWREGRADGSTRGATELSVAVTRSIVPPTTAQMKRAKPTKSEPKPASTEKKPFGMSYDGTSRQDYIKLMISRGAR